jgi:hypothetical protein
LEIRRPDVVSIRGVFIHGSHGITREARHGESSVGRKHQHEQRDESRAKRPSATPQPLIRDCASQRSGKLNA